MELKKRTMKMTKRRSKGKSKSSRNEKGSREKLKDSERKKLRLIRMLIYFVSKKVKIKNSKMMLIGRRLRNRGLKKRKQKKRELWMNKMPLKPPKLTDSEKKRIKTTKK